MLYGPNEIRMFSEMLDTLETYLSPYFNQDYRNAIKKLDKMHPKTLNQLVPNPDRRYRMTTIEKNRMISNEYYKVLREKERLRFAALVKLMDTRNLLLQEEGEMVFDAEEQEKIDKERKNDNRKRRQSRKDDKEPVVEEES